MIRNLAHAIAGIVLILAVGWLTAVPSVHKSMVHDKAAHTAVVCLLIALALFVVGCIWRALRPKKPAPRRTTPYAAPRR